MKKLLVFIALFATAACDAANIHTVTSYSNTHFLIDSTVVPKYNVSLVFRGNYVDINTSIASWRKILVTELLNGDGGDTAFNSGQAIRDYFEWLLDTTSGGGGTSYTAGDQITISGDTIYWSPALQSGLTAGDLFYWDGTDLVRLGVGTVGQVLKVSGGSVPYWDDEAGGTTITGTFADYTKFQPSAGTVDIATIAVPTDQKIRIEVNYLAVGSTNEAAAGKLYAVMYNEAGSCTIIGAAAIDAPQQSNLGGAPSCLIIASGGNMVIRGTGPPSAGDLTWYINVHYIIN